MRSDMAPGEAEGCVVVEASSRPRTWTVHEGDSLRRIAQRVYGNESLWKAIRDANPGKVGTDDAISAGSVLVIPRDGI